MPSNSIQLYHHLLWKIFKKLVLLQENGNKFLRAIKFKTSCEHLRIRWQQRQKELKPACWNSVRCDGFYARGRKNRYIGHCMVGCGSYAKGSSNKDYNLSYLIAWSTVDVTLH
jgi:hypothetical protein